ncbi:hypothetical protein CHARACLAT_025698 [Characodon lateralis]|uniref:Uncharacterized protein n=1 Tax=Characodon lateralis TaxID=208331 RepID=A0ABU7EDD8_9TELE|nr:hypothetical protein [Characodon lateralis]
MSVCQQRDITVLCLPSPDDHRCGRDRSIGKVGVLYGQWHHGNSAVTVCSPVPELKTLRHESCLGVRLLESCANPSCLREEI